MWVNCTLRQGNLPIKGVQNGAFILPICYHSMSPSEGIGTETRTLKGKEAMEARADERHIEMIWFGGIHSNTLFDSVYHVTLQLEFTEESTPNFKNICDARIYMKPLKNKKKQLAQMKAPDRFFYNQAKYLKKPTFSMGQKGTGMHGNKYDIRWFDKNRFIGIMGRQAFHVFDLHLMDFIEADTKRGYIH